MPPTISDTAYAILRALYARGGHDTTASAKRVVATWEIREAIGKDPHPVLGRDIIGRDWAWKWEGTTDLHSPIMATDMIAGVVLTDLGRAAFELGRLERGDELPDPVGPYVRRTGKAVDRE
jgi:hypothetical protein